MKKNNELLELETTDLTLLHHPCDTAEDTILRCEEGVAIPSLLYDVTRTGRICMNSTEQCLAERNGRKEYSYRQNV